MTVASSINVCSTIPGINQPGADAVTAFIGRWTTSKQFDEFCQSQPGYQLSNGDSHQMTALSASLSRFNYPLAIHIITQGGKEIANQGNSDGMPPLFWASSGSVFSYEALLFQKALLDAGANVNLGWKPPDNRLDPQSRTPLWHALETEAPCYPARFTDYTIVLLKQNAVIYPALTEKGEDFLRNAQRILNIINAKQKQISDLKEELKSSPSYDFSVLPRELTVMAINFLHPLYDPKAVFDQDEQLLIEFADIVLQTEQVNKFLDENTWNHDAVKLKSVREQINDFKRRITDIFESYEKMKCHHNPRYPEIFAPDAQLTVQIGTESIMTLNGLKERINQLKKRKVFRERLVDTARKVLIYGILSFVLFISARALLIICRKKPANFNI